MENAVTISNVRGVQGIGLTQTGRSAVGGLRSWLGSSLILVGIALVAFAGLWESGLVTGSIVTLPAPATTRGSTLAVTAPNAIGSQAARTNTTDGVWASANNQNAAGGRMEAGVERTPSLALPIPADRDDRLYSRPPPEPARAARLSIASIDLETEVVQGGIRESGTGELEWETVPFLAVHYGADTALIGGPGNAVIAGHVLTLNEGNVFRNLYLVQEGDVIEVDTDAGSSQKFVVEDVRLVSPFDVSVMAPTSAPRLTLITCGGSFDARRREFSHRLIVVAHPLR